MIALNIPTTQLVTGSRGRQISYLMDLPYGSHYSNATIQIKKGPAVALVGAFSAVSSGVAMGGFLGGVMIAGGIASGLGAITGNKTLSNIGMGMSLAGGIAGAFTNAQTGAFMNPFSEGNSFGETALGSGIAKMKAGVKNFFSDVTGKPLGAGDQLVGAAKANGTEDFFKSGSVFPDGSFNGAVDIASDFNGRYGGSGISLSPSIMEAGSNVAAKPAGLLSSLNNSVGALSIVSGLADGYMKNKELELVKPLREAQANNYNASTDATNTQTGLLNNRYENMQSQPNVGLGVNQDAQVFANTPQPGSGASKVAMVINGHVKYLTMDEYNLLKQQQASNGSGLLAQV